ncbi:MAG: exodeoxyribonuclease VII large subunit [Zetaproteobacteria bacterium CG1_02_49_23]|nr:MAG: exodeoxyribonuclease VII large subunit [Zetaproteobacteria bacterium CG1_02_49_23]
MLEQGFSRVRVCGEVSRVTKPASGHMYFTIKDQHAAIAAVIWRSTLVRMSEPLSEGREFVFTGHLSLYEPRGSYQMVVTRVELAGAGQLAAEYERRKALFASLGWFDSDAKKTIPALPKHIGIVTSASTAAFEDVRKVLATRPAWLRLTLSPAVVQGDQAAASVSAAIAALNSMADAPDVILLVRGGGSVEDLWCFNDEKLVRAIVDSAIPVITGVGHEIDVTLADFAADMRAATPSNAAEVCCPTRQALRQKLPAIASLQHGLRQRLAHHRMQQQRMREGLNFHLHKKMDAGHYKTMQSEHQLLKGAQRQLDAQKKSLRLLGLKLAQHEPGLRLRQQRKQAHLLSRQLQALGMQKHQNIRHLGQNAYARLQRQSFGHVMQSKQASAMLGQRLLASGPDLLEHKQQQSERQSSSLNAAGRQTLHKLRYQWQLAEQKLQTLSPQQVLGRGYSLAFDQHGRLVTGVQGLHVGEAFSVQFHDGRVSARVQSSESAGESSQ